MKGKEMEKVELRKEEVLDTKDVRPKYVSPEILSITKNVGAGDPPSFPQYFISE
jgi:hypothetical protein